MTTNLPNKSFIMKQKIILSSFAILGLLSACNQSSKKEQTQDTMAQFNGSDNEVKIITLNPGHFHAALVQKTQLTQIDPTVFIYAPAGPELENHMNIINGYNSRAENPTNWVSEVYTGNDYLEKMLEEKKGNVVVISGNNEKKTEYIKSSVESGLNVLADKPMAINFADFETLKNAFDIAKQNDVLLYDIMTERFEITTIIQKLLSHKQIVFGELIDGTEEEPAIVKESVHHYFKYVSGSEIKRPAWFFDVTQQGEGIVDVTTHLVDLVQWTCFPEEILDYQNDVEMSSAYRWPTVLTPEQFSKVTRLEDYPEYLTKYANNEGNLEVYANGEINYKLKGKAAKVIVKWNYQAPEGAKDTHYSIIRGTRANLIIQQTEKENYEPTLYIEARQNDENYDNNVKIAVEEIAESYPGVTVEKTDDSKWKVNIPEKYKNGHEAHFGQVMEKYLQYLVAGDLPEWEVPNMITKYYVTTKALDMAEEK